MEVDWQRLLYSSDLTPLDIIFGGCIKDAVSFPSLFATLLELARRIFAAVSTAAPTEPEYRHDMCQARVVPSLNICKLLSVGHKKTDHFILCLLLLEKYYIRIIQMC
jgi:hypothetical protein